MVEVEGCGAGEGCSEMVIVVCVLCEGRKSRVGIGWEDVRVGEDGRGRDGDGEMTGGGCCGC